MSKTDLKNYRECNQPFANANAANNALKEFAGIVEEARNRLKLSNVYVIVSSTAMYAQDDGTELEGQFMTTFSFGGETEMESLTAFAYGHEQAARVERINLTLAGGRKKK